MNLDSIRSKSKPETDRPEIVYRLEKSLLSNYCKININLHPCWT